MNYETSELINASFKKSDRYFTTVKRPQGTTGDQDTVVGQGSFFVKRSCNLTLLTPYIKGLLFDTTPVDTTPLDYAFRHNIALPSVTDTKLVKEVQDEHFKRVYNRDTGIAKEIVRNRYEFLFRFTNPLTHTKYTCLLDRVYRELLITSDLELLMNPFPVTSTTETSLYTYVVAGADNTIIKMTDVDTGALIGELEKDNYFRLGLDYDDLKDPGTLAAAMTDVRLSLFKANTNYMNGDKLLSNEFGTNNYKLLNRDQKIYMCLNLGKLDKFFKNTNKLETFMKQMNFYSLVPERNGGYSYNPSVPVITDPQGNITDKIDLTRDEFFILLSL